MSAHNRYSGAGHLALGLAVAALGVGPGTRAAAPSIAKEPQLFSLSEAHWLPHLKDAALPASAMIQGDSTRGAYTAFLKLPAGYQSPPHSHSSEYWAVVVRGRMTHWAAAGGREEDARILVAGDWVHMPANAPHISKCFPGEDCVAVVVQKGKFDFIVSGR